MNNIIEAYDSYADFSRNKYFALLFNTIPSLLELRVSLYESKENIELILELINFKSLKFDIIFKNWNTTDFKDSKLSEDYCYEYLFRSNDSKALIWISLDENELYIEFLYDSIDKNLENWVIQTNHKLRAELGTQKTPTFKILSKNSRSFFTEKVNTNNFEELDIKLNYNDDFQEINALIEKSLTTNKSGLILLYGKPGTGKTTYIKNLISRFKNHSFIFIQNEFVQELLKPEFISFLIKNKNCILIIEDAEKVVMARESSERSIVSTILQLTDGLFSDYLNIKVICSFNTELKNLDKALFRKGRMIAQYEFDVLTPKKVNNLLQTLGYEETNTEMTLADIYNLKEKQFQNIKGNRIGFN